MKNKQLKRLIPCLFNKDNFLIRSKQFYLHQNIGNFINQAQRFFEWNIDELIYINLGQNNQINEIYKNSKLKIKKNHNIIKNIYSFIKTNLNLHNENEDCLYLNIYSPTCERKKLPVVIWFNGDHFQSNNLLKKNNQIIEKDIVYINFNYRLGIFGFYVHPELDSESKNKISGNYGILDQICMLQWVKENIYYYGGDPDNVTIMGQGSGANSIIYLMCSDLAKGLFHKAIIQSYGMIYNNIYFSNNFSKKKYAIKMADKICGQGKNQILRLRNINAEVINTMYCLNCLSKKKVDTNKLFYPSIDGYIIKDHPFNIFKKT